VNDRVNLISSIEKLYLELQHSEKIETAKFFSSAIYTIKTEKDQEKFQIFLNQLCSSGAIVQYADFSYSEEALFNKIFSEAEKLLSKEKY
jgi:hypothetical protein